MVGARCDANGEGAAPVNIKGARIPNGPAPSWSGQGRGLAEGVNGLFGQTLLVGLVGVRSALTRNTSSGELGDMREAESERFADAKTAWSGVLTSVQPRIRLMRSFDQRSHSYLGYVLRVRGRIGEEEREFSVAIGDAAQTKHQFRVGDAASGEGVAVADPRTETADLYKAAKLTVVERSSAPLSDLRSAHAASRLSIARSSAPRRAQVRVQVRDLHLGLPHACRDDRGSVESVGEALSVRNVLLRAAVVSALQGGADAEGAGASRHELRGGGLGGRAGDFAPWPR